MAEARRAPAGPQDGRRSIAGALQVPNVMPATVVLRQGQAWRRCCHSPSPAPTRSRRRSGRHSDERRRSPAARRPATLAGASSKTSTGFRTPTADGWPPSCSPTRCRSASAARATPPMSIVLRPHRGCRDRCRRGQPAADRHGVGTLRHHGRRMAFPDGLPIRRAPVEYRVTGGVGGRPDPGRLHPFGDDGADVHPAVGDHGGAVLVLPTRPPVR